ncbi:MULTISPECIES: hypothetical protein [Streptomyces]|uniref:hypothetical protein n=1 Tax=Streptomyces TaxID=1883 RepID=UPI00215D5E40|nr:hypothetical protein [Streptomyces griseus]
MDAPKSDGWGVRAEFVDGLREALGVEPGGLAVGAGFVDALTAVGDDQGDERTGPGDHAKGKLHQVEERLRVELCGGVDLLEVQQVHQAIEDTAGHQDRGDEGEGQGPAHSPEPQLPIIRGWSRLSVRCHEEEDKARRPTVAGAGGVRARAAN